MAWPDWWLPSEDDQGVLIFGLQKGPLMLTLTTRLSVWQEEVLYWRRCMLYDRTELCERSLPTNIQSVAISSSTYFYWYYSVLSFLKRLFWFYIHSGWLWVRTVLLNEGTQRTAHYYHAHLAEFQFNLFHFFMNVTSTWIRKRFNFKLRQTPEKSILRLEGTLIISKADLHANGRLHRQ